jgi:peptidylprolyl isomerase
MQAIVRIDDEVIGIEQVVRIWKLTGQFESLVEQFVRDRLTVRAAKKHGVRVAPEEVQERADRYRRVRGLHRAADTNRFLDHLGISLDEFEAFVTDDLYQEKMMQQVCSPQAVERYFAAHSPRFDAIEVSHIVLDAEGAAKEMASVLRDDPGCFAEMARSHSVAATREHGGVIGKVLRGALRNEVEARVFSAAVGEVLGPFASADRALFEIFMVTAKHPATLDEDTAAEIRRLLREEWLAARAREHVIEAR